MIGIILLDNLACKSTYLISSTLQPNLPYK